MNLHRTLFTPVFIAAQLFLLTLVSVSVVKAQSSGVDSSFNAVISKNVEGGNFTLLPDGKILVYGNFQIVNGVAKNQITRLNADGSLDNTFDCAACDFSIGSVVIQPDGKIIVAGSFFSAATNTSVARIKRLNADGSLDNSFVSPYGEPVGAVNSFTRVWAVQPDGKVLIETTTRSASSSVSQKGIYRLNANGSLDNTFTTINIFQGLLSRDSVSKLAVTPDGKIFVSTNNSNGRGAFNRYNSNGTADATFESPILTGDPLINNISVISDFDIQPDGKIVIGGLFTAVNSVSRRNVVRLMPAGNVDLSFVTPNVFVNGEPVSRVKVLSSGQILISTGTGYNTPIPPAAPGNRFFRFNSDGSLDNTFASLSNLVQIVTWEADAADRVLLYGGFLENGVTVFKFARLNTDGSVNTFLNAYLGLGGSVAALAIQPDGKILFAGDFSRVNAAPRRDLARLNADGTLDSTFNPAIQINSPITKIVVQPDGRILLAGTFNINNISNIGIARLNSDGSLDSTFNPILGSNVYSIVLQTDGKILVGGSFSGVNGQQRSGLVRLNADGTTDMSFNPAFGTNTVIRSIVIQPDGKILVGGTFNAVNGFVRQNLVRLNADGSLDAAFNAGAIAPVNQIEISPDGKYLVLTTTTLVKLNNNGTTDSAFQSPNTNAAINTFLVQPDGTIIIGGNFTSVNSIVRSYLARLRADGSADGGFLPSGANNQIKQIVRQADGRIIVGGDFTRIENVTRLGIARLIVAPSIRFTPFDFDGDGKADVSVFRPSSGTWFTSTNPATNYDAVQFGAASDKPVPADYDGDGRTDVAVFRPSNGTWYLLRSQLGFTAVAFGLGGDVPVPADYNGDGQAEIALFRPSSGTWFTSTNPATNFGAVQFGADGDKPISADYDGDGKADLAVFRPSNGVWYLLRSQAGFTGFAFGDAGDKPVPADYDGDGKTDIAVFRPSNGVWYLQQSTGGFRGVAFGETTDLPVPADYDGDGKADIAVFRPSNGVWYLNRSTQGFAGVAFGISEDRPLPNS